MGSRKWLYTAYGKVQRAVTDGRWKLIRYPLINKTQLFDLGSDPHETQDLAADPKHADQMRTLLERLSECQGENGDAIPLQVTDPQPEAWSPAQLTPKQIAFQIEETARCRGEKP
jgi:arylsulfatase A-like enzyme